MTLEEACRLIEPGNGLDALAEVEYYQGFKGNGSRCEEPSGSEARWSLILSVVYRGTMPKPRRLSTMKAGRTREKSTAAS